MKIRRVLLGFLRRWSDLHGGVVAERRQVADNHPFRTVERRPGTFSSGFGTRGASMNHLDPLTITRAGLDLGPDGAAILVGPAVVLGVDRGNGGCWQRRQAPGRSIITLP